MRSITKDGETVTLMTIREVARTGVLSEYALRKLAKEGALPGIEIGTKLLVNYEALIEMLCAGKK